MRTMAEQRIVLWGLLSVFALAAVVAVSACTSPVDSRIPDHEDDEHQPDPDDPDDVGFVAPVPEGLHFAVFHTGQEAPRV